MTNIDSSNAWVFISHSNKDFEKIVQVRNKLERLHYKPLLFFLKCLDDDSEIFDLIKREIKARDRFILCESENSKNSEWVAKEVAYIKSLNRPYEVINLDADENTIDRSIKQFDIRSTMYIWSTDDTFANLVSSKLIDKSYKVCILPKTYLRDYYWLKTGSADLLSSDFHDVKGNGYVLLLITRELNEQEIHHIDFDASYFKLATNYCRPYILSKEAAKHRDLYEDLVNLDGIRPKIIFSGDSNSRDNEQCAEDIINDIIALDKYQHSV